MEIFYKKFRVKTRLLGVLTFALLLFGISARSWGQCTNDAYGQYPTGTSTCPNQGSWTNIATNTYRGEYSLVSVVEGFTYMFGSSVATDITTIAQTDNTVLAYGTQNATWTATFTGNVRFWTHGASCATGSGNRTRRWQITGTPTTVAFGINTWNVAAYNGGTWNATNFLNLTGATYRGYYVDNTLNINTSGRWGVTASPSAAPGYAGCSVNNNQHIFVYKRKGFPTGCYSISDILFDDAIRIYVNGAQVYENTGCCAMTGLAWSGNLDANSEVEIRVAENSGDSRLILNFVLNTPIANPGSDQTISCGNNSVQLGTSIDVFDDFETGTGNWTFTSPWARSTGISTITNRSGSSYFALMTGGSGNNGYYLTFNGTLPAGTSRKISFYFINPGNSSAGFDEAFLDYYNGSSWTTLADIDNGAGSGTSTDGWIYKEYTIPDNATNLRFRPNMYSNTYDGIGIDNITITTPLTYSWSPSTGLSATNISNPVASPTATTTYTLTTTVNGCTSAPASVTVTVNQFNPGTIAADQTICNGTKPVAFTQTSPTGGGGAYAYQWQSAANLTGAWTDISGATSATYTESNNLTADKYYRRKVTDNDCGVAYSTPITPTSNLRLHYKFDGVIQPRTNIVTNTDLNTGWAQGYHKSIIFNEIAAPSGINSPTVGFNRGDASGYWYSYGNYAPGQTPGQTFTVSIYVKTLDNNFRIRCYTADNSELGRVWGDWMSVPNDGAWHRVSWTIDIPGNSQSESLSFNYSYGINDPVAYGSAAGDPNTRTWLCAPQMEMGQGATAFHIGTLSSALVTDYSGNGNRGTISLATAPVWVADNNNGVNGGAYQFNGTSHIDVGNSSSLQITGNQTISMWINPAVLNDGVRRNPYAKAYGGEGTITQEPDGTINYYYGTSGGNGGSYQGFTMSSPIAVNQWVHIAIVRDLTNSQLYWYKNGVLVNQTTALYNPAVAGSLPVTIGTGYAGNYNGKIDDIRVYSSALSATDIKDLYEHSAALHVIVQAPINEGAIAADQTICYGGDPAVFTSTTAGSGDTRGAVTYRWEKSVSPFTAWSAISAATAATYDAPAGLTATTKYRRVTIVTLNGKECEKESAPVTVTVHPQFTSGTIANTGETICNGGDPAVIGSTIAASGGDGTITYKWQANGIDIVGSNAATYDPPSGLTATTTYTRWVKDGTCNTTFTVSANSWTVTVDQKPTLPTSITVDNNMNNCWGREITLTANGGTLQGSSQYVWGTTNGGSQLGTTGNGTKTLVPTASNTYYVGVTANGACPAQNLATGITYALPTRNALLSSNSSGTCYVSGSNPIHFYDASNNYIGSINPQGRTGIVTMSTSVGSPAIQGACDLPSDPKYRTAYLGRIVHVDGSGLSGSGNVDVVLAYSDAELLALQVQAGNGSGGSTPGNVTDDITNLLNPSLGITKVGGDGSLCSGNSVSYLSAGGGVLSVTPSISAARYVSFAVPSFSSFYIHGVNGGSPLPITLTSFTASCEDKVSLMWKTATETNVSHYEILRSRDGQFWEEVATVPAVGNSTTEQVYHATDATGLETMYYKLRSVDNDGTSEDFQPVSVTCNPGALWSIYPVPVSVKATVTVTATETSHDVFVITDINGRVVTTQQVEIKEGTSIFELDLHRLSEGTYFIRMNQSDKYSPLKFIKVD